MTLSGQLELAVKLSSSLQAQHAAAAAEHDLGFGVEGDVAGDACSDFAGAKASSIFVPGRCTDLYGANYPGL
jgi:hypothetical protein